MRSADIREARQNLSTLLVLSLAIANLGTLFRLRMQCLLPLLVIAALPLSRAGRPASYPRAHKRLSHIAVLTEDGS